MMCIQQPPDLPSMSITSNNLQRPSLDIFARPLDECREILKNNAASLTDDEVMILLEAKAIRSHALEKVLNDPLRGVEVRRKYILKQKHMEHLTDMNDISYKDYNYESVMGVCAESVIGFQTVPLGMVGPIKINGKLYHIPMATTEGCLVASTNRGCSALTAAGGVQCYAEDVGMSRAPILEFKDVKTMQEAKEWIEDRENFKHMKSHFESTSRYAKLVKVTTHPVGRKLHLRFVGTTGDAMGMNMLSKATEHTLKMLSINSGCDGCAGFPVMDVLSISGNMCTDKKPSAINWVLGRGKRVVCDATIPADIVEKTLKTSTEKMVKTNICKNLEGSLMAGSIGGGNAHAANIVTAIFIATGQDVAQTIESSNCMTTMEADGRDLYMTVTMPSIEVGTVGGGTGLKSQAQCLEMLGVRGSNNAKPGANAMKLAEIIAATVLAGELSLMSALTEGHLVKSHLRHNRSSATVASMASMGSISDSILPSARQKHEM